jgi:N utilization substance protein B
MLAVQALCLLDALGDSFEAELADFLGDPVVHADLALDPDPPPEVLALARQLAQGAWRNRRSYDELLGQVATGWSLARMTPVDRNALRLGLYELLEMPETPAEVAINEAIELARLFGDEQSPGFVNGVLDAARQRLGVAVGARAGPPRG